MANTDDDGRRRGSGNATPGDAGFNPYLKTPIPPPPSAASLGVEQLTAGQCWSFVRGRAFGLLAVDGFDGAPDIFPLNYLVDDGTIIVRSAPGAKLKSIAAHPAVAFAVIGEDISHHWSVVIRGTAKRMNTDAEIEASGILALTSTSPTPKHNFIRVTPTTMSGRRFRVPRPERNFSADSRSSSGMVGSRRVEPGPGEDVDKPPEISHFAPLPKD